MKKLTALVGLLALTGCASTTASGRSRATTCYRPAACLDGRRVCDWDEETGCRVCSCESMTRPAFGMSRPR